MFAREVLAELFGRILLKDIHQRVQFAEFRLSDARRSKAGGHAFDRGPDGDHLDHLALRLAHHMDAAARDRVHEAFLLQDRQGFADRRPRDTKVLRKLAFVQADLTRMAVDVHVGDGALDRFAGAPAKTQADVQRLNSQPWLAVVGQALLRVSLPDILHTVYHGRLQCRNSRGPRRHDTDQGAQLTSLRHCV